MGHTSKWQFHTGDDHFMTAAGYNRKWWSINKINFNFIIELGIWVIRASGKSIRLTTIFWQLSGTMMYCNFHHWPWHMGHTSLAIGLRLPGSSLLKLPYHSGCSPAARAPGPKWASLSIRQIACSLTTVTEVARLTSPTFQILDASWWYSLTLLENLCLHSETDWKFWWAVLRFSGWVG